MKTNLSERRINLWFAGSSRAAANNNLSASIILDSPHATYRRENENITTAQDPPTITKLFDKQLARLKSAYHDKITFSRHTFHSLIIIRLRKNLLS